LWREAPAIKASAALVGAKRFALPFARLAILARDDAPAITSPTISRQFETPSSGSFFFAETNHA
jgi:hypothetical protein